MTLDAVLSISGLTKTYQGGFRALKGVDLSIRRGEIFALLGPNGAGKTTLIGIVCGLVRPTAGTVIADGHDIAAITGPRGKDRSGAAGTVDRHVRDGVARVEFLAVGCSASRADPAHRRTGAARSVPVGQTNSNIRALSGGMKRRVLIAKALAHEPTILFLDEPTAGVDVELRRDMWDMVRGLRAKGVTIILTTHYIEEAEDMADRIGVIDKGEFILVEEKHALMGELGQTQGHRRPQAKARCPAAGAVRQAAFAVGGWPSLSFTQRARGTTTGPADLLKSLADARHRFPDGHYRPAPRWRTSSLIWWRSGHR